MPQGAQTADRSGRQQLTPRTFLGRNRWRPAHAELEAPLHDQRMVSANSRASEEPPPKSFVLLLAVDCLASV